MSEAKKKPIYKRWWVWALVIVIIVAGTSNDDPPATATTASGGGAQPAQSAATSLSIPADEDEFIKTVAAAQTKAREADNDMQRGGVKAERDKQLCGFMKDRKASGWIGHVSHIGANSDGKGVLEIEVAEDITIKTWNNAFSDIQHKTLLEPGTPLFNTAAALKKGQLVKFSGTFFRGSEGDCIAEASLSLNGKLRDPEFIFRFTDVSPL